MHAKTSAENRKPPFLRVIDEKVCGDQITNHFARTEKEQDPLDDFIKLTPDPKLSEEKGGLIDQDHPFLTSFLIELIQMIKNTLGSIKNTSDASANRFNDLEFRKSAQKSITEDIKRVDSVLNSLMNYIHINTPILKSNTLFLILEEVLEANENQIGRKKIKIIKKCEKDVPETFIHDEQIRFVLNSVLQYAILSTPPGGTIGFLVKSYGFNPDGPDQQISAESGNGFIEVAVGFVGKPSDAQKNVSMNTAPQEQGTTKLILQLVKEILQNNKGGMTYEFDPKKPRTLITLRLPVERRKVVYYEPISI